MKNQEKFVLDYLQENNTISRNFCLSNYISRLSAIILKLKKKGYNIIPTTKNNNGDYLYKLVK